MDFIQNDLGYDPEEVIPALMATTVVFALMTSDPRQALDEAVILLSEPEDDELVGELADEPEILH